jgi:hypothetical protein
VNFSFFFNLFLKKIEIPKHHELPFLILEANENNLKMIPKSSSIKLTWVNKFVTFSLNFKHYNGGEYCYALETNK